MDKKDTPNNTKGNGFLSLMECSALRGIAILGIFLHNYLHWLNPMVKENEYLFHQRNVDRMVELMLTPSWDLPLQLVSFFGHYGVPVFLFLSGYGLVMKYENTTNGSSPNPLHHFRKLFPMMILGFAVFAMVDWITPGRHHWSWLDIITQMTMTINIFPNPDRNIWPGPYWFFGLMMQLYLLYRFAIYKKDSKWIIIITVFCWGVQALCFGEPEGECLNRLRYNCIGGMLPFGMGILLARMKSIPTLSQAHYTSALLSSLVAVLLFSLYFQTWLWVPVFIITLSVSFVKLLPTIGLRAFNKLGILSAAIFVCHPITRKIFIPISRGGEIMDGLILYIVTTLVLAVIFKSAIEKRTNLKLKE